MLTDEKDAMDFSESARDVDQNGYMTIKNNPITRAGIFQYKGSQLPGADPEKIYSVYRPLEELSSEETLASFKGLPILDEHEMVGDRYDRGPEERGTHGSILESVLMIGNDVCANLRIWSRTLKRLIDSGKKGLSLGYNCTWEKTSGFFENMPYDYIQRNIRGNHLALVTQGRSGTAVLDKYDALDHFDLALDTEEIKMADEDKKDEKKAEPKTEAKDGEGEMTLAEVVTMMKTIMPQIAALTAAIEGKADEKKDEMALDADTDKKDGDQDKAEDCMKDKAMDAADVERIAEEKIGAFAKTSVKTIMGQVTARDALAKDLIPHVGSFDYSAMDADDVAAYGVKHLEIEAPKGQERAVLNGYLAGLKKSGTNTTGFALDSATTPKPKADGKLATRLSGAAA